LPRWRRSTQPSAAGRDNFKTQPRRQEHRRSIGTSTVANRDEGMWRELCKTSVAAAMTKVPARRSGSRQPRVVPARQPEVATSRAPRPPGVATSRAPRPPGPNQRDGRSRLPEAQRPSDGVATSAPRRSRHRQHDGTVVTSRQMPARRIAVTWDKACAADCRDVHQSLRGGCPRLDDDMVARRHGCDTAPADRRLRDVDVTTMDVGR
jgi:hypothetical protein